MHSRPTRLPNFMPLALSAAKKSVTVQKETKSKCVRRLARCIPHHTALSNATARNSDCPPSLAAGARRWYVKLAAASLTMENLAANSDVHPGTNAAPVTPRKPIFTKAEKTCPDTRPTRMQNFTLVALSAAEKSVTVQRKKQKRKTSASAGLQDANPTRRP